MKQGSDSPNRSDESARNELPSLGGSYTPRQQGGAGRLAYGYSHTATQRERPLREYINILIQYRWIIVATTVIGIFIGAHRLKQQPTIYETSAMVNVGSYVAPTEGPTADNIRYEMSKAEYLENLLPILSSYAIARKVLANNSEIVNYLDPSFIHKNPASDLGLARSANDSTAKANISDLNSTDELKFPVSMLDSYLSHIFHTKPVNTTLISVTATDGDPKMASLMANAHANAFMELVRQQRFIWATTNVDFLTQRQKEVSLRAHESEVKMLDFAKKHMVDIGGTNRIGNEKPQRFDSILSSLGDATLERVTSEQDLRDKRRSLYTKGVSIDERTWDLMPQLSKLQAEYDRARAANFNSYYLSSIDRQIKDLKQLMRMSTEATIKEAHNKNRGASEKERLLKNELEAIRRYESERSDYMLEFNILEREAKISKEELQKIETRLEEATINARSDQKTVTLVDAAVIPNTPIAKGKISLIVSGLLFGFFLGIGIAFFIDYYRAAIKTVSDLSALVEAPMLGVIPNFAHKIAKNEVAQVDGERANEAELIIDPLDNREPLTLAFDMIFLDTVMKPPRNTATLISQPSIPIVTKPHSRESEAFRNIRATLRYSSRQGPPKLVLVTSGQKGDGKSTVAVNLAASIAQTGTKTLIIDADMRMPTMHTYFGINRTGHGLSDYLRSQGTFHDFVVPTGIENLSIMVAGSTVDNPAELIGSRTMLDLLEQVSTEYDQVFIDTPPVGEIADALLLARAVTGVVLVVRSGVTPKGVAQLAVRRLDQIRAKIIGLTLNGLRDLDGYADGYTGYYYYSKKS